MKENVYVGIDISKRTFNLMVYDTGETCDFTNDFVGIEKAAAWLKELNPTLVVMEATGGMELPLYIALEAVNCPVTVVNPRQVRDFARATGRLAKTDRLDAGILAFFAATIKPEPRPFPEQALRELKARVTRRQQIVNMIAVEKNRLSSSQDKMTKEEIKAHIAWLKSQLQDVNKDITKRLSENPVWQEKAKLLRSVPGVGPVLASTLIAQLPELGQTNRCEAAALVGVAPMNHDSGAHKGKRSIKGGRSRIRGPLYMGTLSAVRYNPVIRDFFQRLKTAGKAQRVVLVACMHKLLSILNSMVKHNTFWKNPTFTVQNCL